LFPKGRAPTPESSAAAKRQPSVLASSPAHREFDRGASSTAWSFKTKHVGSLPTLHPILMKTATKPLLAELTPPEDNAEGVVMIAVCNKRDVRSDADARRDVESELRNEEGVLLVARLSS
jgi:hypothetical protein